MKNFQFMSSKGLMRFMRIYDIQQRRRRGETFEEAVKRMGRETLKRGVSKDGSNERTV